jgi:hypothetical protein
VNETPLLVPEDVATVTFRPPLEANRFTRKVAVIKPEFTMTTFDTVTPLPCTATVAGDLKLLPFSETATVAPLLAETGVIEVRVGRALGGAVTVNVLAVVVPPDVVTVTLRAPVAAAVPIVNVAVMRVALATTTLLTATPDPLTATTAPEAKPLPVNATATAVPCTPDDGETLLSTGTTGAEVMVTVADPTADGDALLAACTDTAPPAGTAPGAV